VRDIAVTLAVFGSLPFILWRPWLGVLVFAWLGFMNPHRMAWGFSTTMPFAMIVALTTLVGMLISREPKKIPWTRESVVLLCLILWMVFTTFFAIYPALAWVQLEKVVKIQLMIFVAMMLITTRERLHWFVVVIALSIGFYGVKGGIFTIIHGGVHRVMGPPGTFIGGNNEIGLALAMTVPLLYYMVRYTRSKLLRLALVAAMILTAIAAIGTQSRGALLGVAGMGVFLWLKSRQKFWIALIMAVSAFAIVQLMPESWYARIRTIETYDQDASALGRINAWKMAFNLASQRFTGGGFETFRPEVFAIYAPEPTRVHDAHSVFFEILGEHGFVGLALFLTLGLFTWFTASRITKLAEKAESTRWLGDLCRMVQVSMVAYAAAGAFLGLGYFDYYYSLIVIVIAARGILAAEQAALAAPARAQPRGTLRPAATPARPPALAPRR
jgi:probable O-glycosylation ligase (exosortase A-associated)